MSILPRHGRSLLLLLVSLCPSHADSPLVPPGPLPSSEKLQYNIEWRLITAGKATLAWTGAPGRGYQTDLQVESAGLVSKLFKVNDEYSSKLDHGLCGHSSL